MNTATGNFIEPETDLSFTGGAANPVFTRMHDSPSTNARVFGPGWASPADEHLVINDEGAVRVQASGRPAWSSRGAGTRVDHQWAGGRPVARVGPQHHRGMEPRRHPHHGAGRVGWAPGRPAGSTTRVTRRAIWLRPRLTAGLPAPMGGTMGGTGRASSRASPVLMVWSRSTTPATSGVGSARSGPRSAASPAAAVCQAT
ncbi:DUF6531 domain-containing protein [uncultured Propionibacterium sp.]|uniref:DUF6531 domain-containing protein n=1 Tax=uncultured Propionibacterium sp. TaxID=218066 RepID=UPI0037DD0719